MIRVVAGRLPSLAPALIRGVGDALEKTDRSQMVVVPKQLTLHTELELIRGLNLRGSFRIQVLSVQRLCQKIFDEVGSPPGERIDERGRAMLVHAALREADGRLRLYKSAWKRRGFALRAARQIELLQEAGLAPEELARQAEDLGGVTGLKLADLSVILEQYDSLSDGKFLDGETETRLASAKARESSLAQDWDTWFYGFDIMPPSIMQLMARLGAAAERVTVFLPFDPDENAPDAEVFTPIRRSADRLRESCRREGAGFEVAPAPPQVRANGELRDLSLLLYGTPSPDRPASPPRSVQLAALRDAREEARFAAALARTLVRTREWKWQDIAILASDIEAYSQVLSEAFADCGIPLVLSDSRPASRHSLSEAVLCAVDLAAKGFAQEDMLAYLGTGYALPREEADYLANYAVARGITGRAFARTFTRGEDAEEAEVLRDKVMTPLLRLRDSLRKCETLPAQLASLYAFLEETGAYTTSLALQKQLADAGERRESAELAQVWNRIMGTLDQLHALFGEKRLSMAELSRVLRDALDATEIKSLPQSGDAVLAQSAGRVAAREVKALILIGMSDAAVTDNSALLTESQRRVLADATRSYLGPDPDESSLIRRFFLKSGIMMAGEYVCASYPLSGLDGRAQRPGNLFRYLRQVFPGLALRGGMAGDRRLDELLRESPAAALTEAARELSRGGEAGGLRQALASIPAARPQLERLRRALSRRSAAESLSPAVTDKLYRDMKSLSVSRLETFAACPFSYFTQFGLRPEVVEPFDLTVQDEGVFFHEAVYRFTRAHMQSLGQMSPDEAESRMDEISSALLDDLLSGAAEDRAVTSARRRQLSATARSAARTLAQHMIDSQFHTASVELSFGGDGDATLTVGEDGCALRGRIDRIDEWLPQDGNKYLRVIDYKRGGKTLDLSEAYYGTQLQLLIYLASALAKRGGNSAGVYYFKLSDGILNTQSTDPGEIAALRKKETSLTGLVPNDTAVISAMSPDPSVAGAHVKGDGSLDKRYPAASQDDFRRLARHAINLAGEDYSRIRSGDADISPLDGASGACKYCKWRRACAFDAGLDASRIRHNQRLRWDEVLARLAAEDPTKKSD